MRAVETRRVVEDALREHERGEPKAAERMLRKILSHFPHHQAARMAMARLLEETRRAAEAVRHYQAVTATDPTHLEAREALRRLTQDSEGEIAVPEGLAEAERAWREGRGAEVEPLLAALAASHRNLVRVQLMLGDLRLRAGDWVDGSQRLHVARSLDPSLEVARSLFVERGLYPEYLATAPTLPAPGADEVAPPSQPRAADAAEAPLPPDQEEEPPRAEPAQRGSEELSLSPEPVVGAEEMIPAVSSLSGISVEEDSPPDDGASEEDLASALAIVSSRARLEAAFGEEGLVAITQGLAELQSAVRAGSGLEAHLILVDDHESLLELGLTMADAGDPASVARLLGDLENRLGEAGQRVDYLLLVGGDDIVPFFRIPSPANDGDEEILSDAPYAARGGNYLLPDRAVGRVPDLGSSEALTEFIARMAAAHRKRRGLGGRLERLLAGSGSKPLAVSAGVWRDASAAVMRSLGDGRGLKVSPPFSDQEFLEAYDRIPPLAYFNLHGVAGSPYWYGHGSGDDAEAPAFPIALTPLNLTWSDPDGAVVFSEACYGAEIQGRSAQDSVALAFLAAGARGFIGSTAMAYGSVAPPLVGADLLGVNLWMALREGFSLGEALRRAKLGLIEHARDEQGFLDAEDQKTLLTFVLYGDPTLGPSATPRGRRRASEEDGAVECPAVICGHGQSSEPDQVPDSIRQTLESYLGGHVPTLAAAEMSVKNVSACACGGCSICPSVIREVTEGGQPEGPAGSPAPLWVASAVKNTPLEGDPQGRSLRHRAVVTADAHGRIKKLFVSR